MLRRVRCNVVSGGGARAADCWDLPARTSSAPDIIMKCKWGSSKATHRESRLPQSKHVSTWCPVGGRSTWLFFRFGRLEIEYSILTILARASHSLRIIQHGGIEVFTGLGISTFAKQGSGTTKTDPSLLDSLSVLDSDLLITA